MDPAPEGVAADHADQPKYKENNGDGPKHCFSPESARPKAAKQIARAVMW
jgi:hypothetical protein